MDALEDRINSMNEDEQLEYAKLLIEKGLIVRPENLPVEYNGVPLFDCMMMVKAKPEQQMKRVEKAFIRSFIKTFTNYIKQEIKEEKKQKLK